MSTGTLMKYRPPEEDISEALFDALIELMQQTPIDSLSVSSIIEKAHVSRASFYRRYKDKYDLLNREYERILEHTLFTFHEGTSWREAVSRIYRVIQENAVFFQNAFCSGDRNSLRNYIFERTLKLESDILTSHGVDISDPGVYYRLHGYVAGGLEVTMLWVSEGASFDLDRLVDILVEMVPDLFREYFR